MFVFVFVVTPRHFFRTASFCLFIPPHFIKCGENPLPFFCPRESNPSRSIPASCLRRMTGYFGFRPATIHAHVRVFSLKPLSEGYGDSPRHLWLFCQSHQSLQSPPHFIKCGEKFFPHKSAARPLHSLFMKCDCSSLFMNRGRNSLSLFMKCECSSLFMNREQLSSCLSSAKQAEA